ncbi:MAG: hypothetical protein GY810_10070 [Aureispira sp.]|nr:hypothetical protein [Aureispira sp.]
MYDVVIIGYGLVGNMAALLLGHYGIRTAVIEKKALGDLPIAKAGRVDGEVVRMFKQLKLWDKLESVMHPLEGTQVIDKKGNTLLEFKESALKDIAPVYGFYQPDVQRILQDCVQKRYSRYVDLYTSCELETIEQLEDGVEVFVHHHTAYKKIATKYLLVCNGQNSTIPEASGLIYKIYDSLKYTLNVDTFARDAVQVPTFAQTIYDADPPVTRITNNEEHQRWEFRLTKDEVDNASGTEQVLELLQKTSAVELDIKSAFVHPFQAKILKQWHSDRVIIAGDAAHIMPPYLGMGLSAGIKDVYNVVWKLQLLLDGIAKPALLNFYKGERELNVRYLIQLNLGIKRLFNSSWLRWLRRVVKIIPKGLLKRTLDTSSLIKYGVVGKLHKSRGRLFPLLMLRQTTGKILPLDQATDKRFVVLGLNQNPVDAIAVKHIEYLAKIRAQFVKVIPSKEPFQTEPRYTQLMQDHTGELQAWMEAQKIQFVILRPDYVLYDAAKDSHQLNKTLSWMQKKLPLEI